MVFAASTQGLLVDDRWGDRDDGGEGDLGTASDSLEHLTKSTDLRVGWGSLGHRLQLRIVPVDAEPQTVRPQTALKSKSASAQHA